MDQHLATALDIARRFLRWWLGELAFLVPSRLQKRLIRSDVLVLSLGADLVTVTHQSGGGEHVLGEVVMGGDDVAGQVARILDRVDRLRRRVAQGQVSVAVRLPADRALRTRIRLPLAAEENLRAALVFQIDRRTPFSPDTVHFAFRVLARDQAAKQLDVELTVVERSVVAAGRSAGQALGFHPSIVQIGPAHEAGSPSPNLLPDGAGSPRRPAIMVIRAGIAALAVGAVIGLYQPIYRAERAAGDLRRELEMAKQLSTRGRKLQVEVAKLTETERFLVGGKKAKPSATEILCELTHLLPDDTWLREIHIGAGEIRISGFSKSASNLIEILERSPAFADPRFGSAVTQDQATGKERFEITAKIATRSISS